MIKSELLNDVRRWLRFGREDLEVAEALLSVGSQSPPGRGRTGVGERAPMKRRLLGR